MLSCYFQEKQRSFTSGDFWVLPRRQVTHFQFLSVFQDGGHVKFPTLGQHLNVKIPTQGKACSVNFPWVAHPPPPTLGLNIDRCIIIIIIIKTIWHTARAPTTKGAFVTSLQAAGENYCHLLCCMLYAVGNCLHQLCNLIQMYL